jgi:hypothetical protein
MLPLQTAAQRTCGTGDYFQKAVKEDPAVLQRVMDAKAQADQWLKVNGLAAKKTGTIITIPVVVHVLYENTTENISDAQVISQIEVLNEDYRKLNSDTGNVPAEFKSVAADVEVEFCLAVRDPDGIATNGITRTSTTVTNFASGNPKSTSAGGKDAWPNGDYLNFWVCDLGSGLLGYATPPGANPSQDGVVCGYQYVGKPPANTFSGPFNKGRTATHEVGHYLGLAHTFQSGCSGTSASNCATSGDDICDTPPTASSNYGCPSMTQNTCTETPVDQNDQHMNYMDYVDDGCMNLFTDDQKSRMRSVLNSTRAGLNNSLGCTPVSGLDASIALVAPQDTICGSDQFAPVVTLYNYGSSTLATTTINYQIDAGSTLSYIWTGTLATLSSEEVTLPMISTSLGSHTFYVWTSSPNGGPDEETSNDSTNSAFTFMNGNSVSLTLDYDTFQLANLVTWDIQDGSGVVVGSGGGYSQNTTNLESICLEPGCYSFNLYDNVDNGEGSFLLVDVTGDTITEQNDIFTYSLTFCVSLPPISISEQQDMESLVTIFPNPTDGLVRITSELLKGGAEEIAVLNTVGQLVYALKNPEVRSGSLDLDLVDLPGGVYFIRIRTAHGTTTAKVSLMR